MADTENTRPGLGMFIQGFKRIAPQASDVDFVELYDELKAAGDDTSKQEAVTRAWANKVKGVQTVEVNGKRSTAALDAATPIPPAANLPTTVPSPLRGTTQAAANPANPQASGLSQFDPAALQAAQNDYAARQQANQSARLGGGILSSMASGWDGGKGMDANRQLYDQMDKEALLQTVGAQQARQAQATAGQAAMTSQQNQDIAAGKFQTEQAGSILDQAKKRAELIVSSLGTQQQQRMNDPSSPETLMLKKVIAANIATLPPAAANALKGILADSEGVSAMQLLPVIGQYAPALQKSYLDALSGAGKQADTRLTNANANLAETGAGNAQATSAAAGLPGRAGNSTPAPNARIQPGDADRTRIYTDELADIQSKLQTERDPAKRNRLLSDAAALTREMQANKIQVPPLAITGVGPNGIPTLAPQPGWAERQASNAVTKQQYVTSVKPVIDDITSLLDKTYSGKGANALKNFIPSDINLIAAKLAQLQGNNLPPGLLTKDKDGIPTLDPNLTPAQLRDILGRLDSSLRGAINYTGNEQVPNTPAPGPSQPTQKPNILERALGATASPGKPAAPAAAPGKNSKGWLLHTDKNGNRAYVSPDGKQFEEVK